MFVSRVKYGFSYSSGLFWTKTVTMMIIILSDSGTLMLNALANYGTSTMEFFSISVRINFYWNGLTRMIILSISFSKKCIVPLHCTWHFRNYGIMKQLSRRSVCWWKECTYLSVSVMPCVQWYSWSRYCINHAMTKIWSSKEYQESGVARGSPQWNINPDFASQVAS